MNKPAPQGFEPFTRPSPLLEPWRPIFSRHLEDRVLLGLHLRDAHCNSRGTAHGGLLASLADQAMGMSCGLRLHLVGIAIRNLWTASLGVEYLGTATLGQWILVDTHFAHVGKTLCRAEADLSAEGQTIARAHGAFRVDHQASSSS